MPYLYALYACEYVLRPLYFNKVYQVRDHLIWIFCAYSTLYSILSYVREQAFGLRAWEQKAATTSLSDFLGGTLG